MARTAVKNEKENEIENNNVENIETNDVESINKNEGVQKTNDTIADQDAKIAKLEEALANMQSMIAGLMNVNQLASRKETPERDQEITIICNVHGGIKTHFPTWTLSMSKFGQKMIVTRQQIQELVNSHRKYFDREYILLDSKHIDVGEQLDIPVYDTTSGKYIKPEDLGKIAHMSIRQLEDYYNNLSVAMQRTFIGWFMSKCYDKDPDFYTVDKMMLMNNLTKGDLFGMLITMCVTDSNSKQV